jgi:poly(beta-D-mannuronate) lyase
MGQSVRKWALATMAISYLKLTQTNSTPPMPTRLSSISKSIIENWLVMVAEDVRKHYSHRPIEKVNNHDYWAAWAVMATAVISNREDLFNWSLEKFHLGISQIDDQGYLPNELKRETRALSYHNFALQPLVWMAVFSEVNDRGLNDSQFRALSKLATSTISGLRDPAIFSDLTGYEQYVDGLDTSYSLAWIEVWASTFPELNRMSENLVRLRPMKSTRLGGNVSLLFKGPDLASKRIQKRKDK